MVILDFRWKCRNCGVGLSWADRSKEQKCRECGLHCKNCANNLQDDVGQGGASTRICSACILTNPRRLENQGSKTKARLLKTKAFIKRAMASSSEDDVADTWEGSSEADVVNSERILAGLAENDGDDHELTSPSEDAPVSLPRLYKEEAQEETYTALRKQGKDADALEAFKRTMKLKGKAENFTHDSRCWNDKDMPIGTQYFSVPDATSDQIMAHGRQALPLEWERKWAETEELRKTLEKLTALRRGGDEASDDDEIQTTTKYKRVKARSLGKGAASHKKRVSADSFSNFGGDHEDAHAKESTGVDEPHHMPNAENIRSAPSPQLGSDSIIEDVVKYTWGQVLDLTNNRPIPIGVGGFGQVYLGKRDDGKEVAVKILDAKSQQGPTEFLNEVNLLKRVNHVYLVRLLGYCLDTKQVLIYEFAEEGSIWDHLQVGAKFLDWKTRLKVALEAACGLEYLHTGCHPRIIHRDIKSQNILLTKSMVAKVADFGLSKLGADQDNVSKTHVTTTVKGTLGYMDPEYATTGHLTTKSDVYNFGVFTLEMISGRKPIQNRVFIGDWVKGHYKHLKRIVDNNLGDDYDPKALKLMVDIAKECIHPKGENRPEMTEVVQVLRKAQMIIHDEKKPSYSKWLPFR